jgi:uncharacterized protein with von Willebrand factor type A (vWA) domain
MPDGPALADLADAVAGFGKALRAAGLPVGPDRLAMFAGALEAASPRTPHEVRECARATLAWTHDQIALLDRVFDAVFVPAAAGKPRVSGQQAVVAGSPRRARAPGPRRRRCRPRRATWNGCGTRTLAN